MEATVPVPIMKETPIVAKIIINCCKIIAQNKHVINSFSSSLPHVFVLTSIPEKKSLCSKSGKKRSIWQSALVSNGRW
jgi:hypothetical protein